MSKRGYNYLSKHGTQFVDLSIPGNISKLTKRQREYMEEYERMYKAVLSAETMETYNKMPDLVQLDWVAKQEKIFSGRAHREAYKTFIENYATALENYGWTNLGNALRIVAKKSRKEKTKMALYDELEDLDIWYPRDHDPISKTPSHATIVDSIGTAAKTVVDLAYQYDIDIFHNGLTPTEIGELHEAGYITRQQLHNLGSMFTRMMNTHNKQDIAYWNELQDIIWPKKKEDK